MRARTPSNKVFHLLLVGAFIFNLISPSFAQEVDLKLPKPSQIKPISKPFAPAIIRAVTVNPKDPFLFDFIIDKGDSNLDAQAFEDETQKLVKYFLAALTIPENDLWVNLSPYEQDSMVPRVLGVTELGKDLLIEDYYLKQVTASLTNPNTETGKKFWTLAYAKAQELYGTTKVPINTFSKVWIVPDQAVVLEKDGSAFIADSHLKVFLDQDYVAIKKNLDNKEIGTDKIGSDKAQDINGFSAQIIKEVVLPEIEKEVNTGENFATVRQIYSSAILAAWYKKRLKESLLGRLYADQNKVAGVNAEDMDSGDKIFEKYTAALKTGAYNIIKQDFDLSTQKIVQRKYFSGGATFAGLGTKITFQQAATAAGQAFSAPTPAAVQSALAFSKSVTAFADGQNMAGASAKPGSFEAGNYQYTKVSVRVASAAVATANKVTDKINAGTTTANSQTAAILAVSQAVSQPALQPVSQLARAISVISTTSQEEIANIAARQVDAKSTPDIKALSNEQKQTALTQFQTVVRQSQGNPLTPRELSQKLSAAGLSGAQTIFVLNQAGPFADVFDSKVNALAAFASQDVSEEILSGALGQAGVANVSEVVQQVIAMRSVVSFDKNVSLTSQITQSNSELAQKLNELASNEQVQIALGSIAASNKTQSPAYRAEASLERMAGDIYAASFALPPEKIKEVEGSLDGKKISRATVKVLVGQASQIDPKLAPAQIIKSARNIAPGLATLLENKSIRSVVLASARSSNASSSITPVQNILASVSGVVVDAKTEIPDDHPVVTYFRAIADDKNKINPVALVRTIAAASNAAKGNQEFKQNLDSAETAEQFKTVIKDFADKNPDFAALATPAGMESLAQLNDNQIRKVGGIDLSAERMDLKIKRDGNGVVLPVSDQDMENLKIDGLAPVILDVQPATPASVPFLMNLANTAAQTK